MLSFLRSVTVESLKAKSYAQYKIRATKSKVESLNTTEAKKQRLIYTKFLQNIKFPFCECSIDSVTLSRKRMSLKSLALSLN